jgi:ferredoxin-NAD(P)+ reductase (naphthalene dioxygenase ferredoxin-specific)
VRINWHDLAEPVPIEASDTFFDYLIKARVPLTDSRQSGNRGILENEGLRAHPSRVVLCRVDGLNDLTHDIRELRLAIEAGGPFNFFAGQYARIEFACGLSRHYSMASTPAEEGLVFQLRRALAGATSSYVAQELKLGDRVKVSGPLGSSYLRGKHAGPVLLVAGGSGLAPIYSVLCTLLQRGSGERVALYFGVRSERDVYHERMLAGLAAIHGNFSYQIVLSKPEGESGRRHGLVHQAVADDVADAAGYTAYLAGPPAMVEAAGQLLLSRGVARRDIHADAFRYQSSGR